MSNNKRELERSLNYHRRKLAYNISKRDYSQKLIKQNLANIAKIRRSLHQKEINK